MSQTFTGMKKGQNMIFKKLENKLERPNGNEDEIIEIE
jgi:hypothetical protein